MKVLELRAVEAVNRGAKFLDKNVPGWWCRIEKEISICDLNDCVLGQLFGDFLTATEALFITPEFAEHCGFCPLLIPANEGYLEYTRFLNEHWNALVGLRKQQWGLA